MEMLIKYSNVFSLTNVTHDGSNGSADSARRRPILAEFADYFARKWKGGLTMGHCVT